MTFYEAERYLNMLLAFAAVILIAETWYHNRHAVRRNLDQMFRYMSLLGLLDAYLISTTLAINHGIPAGAWTVCWTPALAWALIAGWLGRVR